MDNDNYSVEDLRKAFLEQKLREKLYTLAIEPKIEEIRKLYGIIVENKNT